MKNEIKTLKKIEMIKRIVILTVVVLSIIPILIISRYNHPSADDFGYSIKVHHAVENNASAMEILEAAFETSKEYMNTWQGLYSAAFLLALQPAAFGEKYYALTAVIMLFIVALGVFVLTHSISTNLIKSSSKSWYYIAAIIFLYIIQGMPSPVEGLFWFNGAVNYLFFWGITLCNMGLVIRFYNKKKAYFSLIMCICLSFVISGGNHITGFVNILLLIFSFVYALYKKRKRLIGISVVFGILGFWINLTSPGTAIRMASDGVSNSIIKTIIRCGYQSIVCNTHFFTFSFLLMLIALTPFMIKLINSSVEEMEFNPKVCVGLIALDFVILSAMYCVPYYAMGVFGEGRVSDTIFATYVVLITITYAYFIGCIRQCEVVNEFFVKINQELGKRKVTKVIPHIVVIGIVSYISIIGNGLKDYSTGMKSLIDLNEAKVYDMEYQQRIQLINDKSMVSVEFEKFSNEPYLLFFSDIEDDDSHWKNRRMAEYYGKKVISLKDNSKVK